jgi:hypothetical protein
MTDDDLGLGEQRRQTRDVAFIGEDLGLERRLHLGQDARRDGRGETAEEKRLHGPFFRIT